MNPFCFIRSPLTVYPITNLLLKGEESQSLISTFVSKTLSSSLPLSFWWTIPAVPSVSLLPVIRMRTYVFCLYFPFFVGVGRFLSPPSLLQGTESVDMCRPTMVLTKSIKGSFLFLQNEILWRCFVKSPISFCIRCLLWQNNVCKKNFRMWLPIYLFLPWKRLSCRPAVIVPDKRTTNREADGILWNIFTLEMEEVGVGTTCFFEFFIKVQ